MRYNSFSQAVFSQYKNLVDGVRSDVEKANLNYADICKVIGMDVSTLNRILKLRYVPNVVTFFSVMRAVHLLITGESVVEPDPELPFNE